MTAALAALAMGCSTRAPARAPAVSTVEEGRSGTAAQWPESWGIEFALRCSAAGEDVRVCTCIANEVQRRWTPEQFRARGPEGLQDEVRVCRERLGGAGTK